MRKSSGFTLDSHTELEAMRTVVDVSLNVRTLEVNFGLHATATNKPHERLSPYHGFLQ